RQAEQTVMLAEADSKQKVLAGRGEGAQRLQVGLSEVAVLLRKIGSYGDPRLYALTQAAEALSHSQQPLVPEKMFIASGANGESGSAAPGLLGTLISLLVAEKSGFTPADADGLANIKELTDKMARDALAAMQQAAVTTTPETPAVAPSA